MRRSSCVRTRSLHGSTAPPRARRLSADGSADLDGDGLPELWGTSGDPSNPTAVRRVVSRGSPPEVWKRLGRWLPGQDYDRDGISDLIGPDAAERSEVDAISGRDGRVLWSARPDRSGTPVPRTGGSLFRFVPLAEGVGDLDGDGVPEIALSRERFGDAFKADDTATAQLASTSSRAGRAESSGPIRKSRVIVFRRSAASATSLPSRSMAEMIFWP